MKVYKYGDDSQQYGQLYRMNCGRKLPVVIIIHGGYWKDNHTLDTYPTKEIVKFVSKLNVAVWNLEYRRMNTEGENLTAPWPTVFSDVMHGIDYLKTIAIQEYLDLNRVVVIGHSAGGHLATWAASREKINVSSQLYTEKPLKINRLISIAGVLDLNRPLDLDQPLQITKLLEGSVKGNYPELSNSNPNQLHHNGVAMTVIHGDADKTVNISQAYSYLKNAGSNVRFIELSNADHFSMLPTEDIDSPYWRLLKNEICHEIKSLDNHLHG